jgi:CheY-like chemotaxis protein
MITAELAPTSPTSPFSQVNSEEIQQQVNRILASDGFRVSRRLSSFLSFVISQVLSGSDGRLKEYSIALEVFGKPESFDPRLDSTVRVAARQLRIKIDAYYLHEGVRDPIMIRFRPGTYAPRIYQRSQFANVSEENGFAPSDAEKVFVVDSDRTTTRVLTDALDQLGIKTPDVIFSAEEALVACGTGSPDLALISFSLVGEANGADLIRSLRARSSRTVLVAVIPANACDDALRQLLEVDADAIAFSPLRVADVAAAVRLAFLRRTPAPVMPLAVA